MIQILEGEILMHQETYFVVSCNGIGFKVSSNAQTLSRVPQVGSEVVVYTKLLIRDNFLELFGFFEMMTLNFFETLTTVSGVGPRTALAILDLDTVPRIMTAIVEKRVDLLTRVSGIGKKTAERVILELQDKIKIAQTESLGKPGSSDRELEDVLISLGVDRREAKEVLQVMNNSDAPFEERLKTALRTLGKGK